MDSTSKSDIPPCSKRWSKKDQDAISEIRNRLSSQLKGSPFPEVVGDRRILRFLRGKKYDLDKATEMVSKHLEWRQQNKVNEIRQDIVYGGKNSPFLFPHGKHILSNREEIVVTGLARDRKGRPICFESYNFDPKEVLKHLQVDEFLVYMVYSLEYRTLVMEQISHEHEQEYLRNHPDPEDREEGYGVMILNCTIRDLKGVGLGHSGVEGRTILTSALSIGIPNYEEFLGKGIFVNTPWLFKTLWFIISKFLDEDILAKLSFHGADFMETLQEDIALESIPAQIGGNFTSYNEAYIFNADEGGPLAFSPEQWAALYGPEPMLQVARPIITNTDTDTNIKTDTPADGVLGGKGGEGEGEGGEGREGEEEGTGEGEGEGEIFSEGSITDTPFSEAVISSSFQLLQVDSEP